MNGIKTIRFTLIVLFSTATFCLTSACVNVKPFQREFLADPIMQFTLDAEEDAYDQHMHRALSQGLYGVASGGGGCGCEQ